MNRTESPARMGAKTSSAGWVFLTVLRAFETGGFTYADVLAQMRRLLATGASPTEMLELLRRHELIEPLPESAHAGVLDILNDAIRRDAAEAVVSAEAQDADPQAMAPDEEVARQHADYEALTRFYEPTREAESAVAARAAALAADLAAARSALESERSKTQEIDKALAERITSTEAALARTEEAQRASERYQTESRTLRDSLAARDATIAQVLHSLSERDAQLTALQQEHAKIVAALDARANSGTQLETDLRAASARATALAADLAAARNALESEQSKTREIDKALAVRIALAEAARARSEEAQQESERYQTESHTLRDSLTALQHEHAKIVAALEARAETGVQLEADLQVALARADAISLELKVGQEAAAVLNAQLKSSESRLNAALTELGAAKTQSSSYLELLRTREWRRGFDQNMFHELAARVDAADVARGALQAERDRLYAQVESLQRKLETQDVLVEKAQSAANADSQRAAELHAAAQLRESEQAAKFSQLQAQQAAQMAQLQSEQAAQVAEVESARAARIAQLVPDAETREQESPALMEDSVAVGGVSKPRAIATAMQLSAVVFVLAVVAWIFVHRAPVPTQVPAASSPAVPKPGTVIRDCPTCPAMTILPAGRFKQGSAYVESASASFEKPLHWVIIRRPFAMSTNVVTVDDFQQFIAATGRDVQGCDTYDGKWKHRPENSWRNPGFMQSGTHPVTCASWNDAEAYARWLSTKTGRRYRLPSASEWEYAARAGGEAVQPWNPDGSGACANANVADESAAREYPGWVVFACDDGYVHTAPVGSFKANSFGLNDMLGNVFQWTEDCWHADYTGAPIDGSARTDGNCSERELRGGSWFTTPAYVRANYRNHFAADYRTSSVGIRLVRDIEQ